MKQWKILVAVVAVLVIGFSCAVAGCTDDSGPDYSSHVIEAKVVRITEKPYVRKWPELVQLPKGNNSFGRVEEDNFTIEISKYYKSEIIDSKNGEYYGLLVEEILAVPEGRWFPEGIKDDEDGVVWINHEYIQPIV